MSIEEQEILSEQNFVAFVNSGRPVKSIGAELDIEGIEDVPGRVYMESFYIEGRPGHWELNIENQSYGSEKYSLAELEGILFDWAEADGCFE